MKQKLTRRALVRELLLQSLERRNEARRLSLHTRAGAEQEVCTLLMSAMDKIQTLQAQEEDRDSVDLGARVLAGEK